MPICQQSSTLSEFSPNDGLHFLVKLEKPLPEACKSDVEIYDRERYMTFTMDTVPGTPLVIATRQAEIEQLWSEFKSKEKSATPHTAPGESTRPRLMDEVDWHLLPPNHLTTRTYPRLDQTRMYYGLP
jgi:hypothetical protein